MASGSQKRLAKAEVAGLLERLEDEVPPEECWSCECLQGFIAQLELDAADDAKPPLTRRRVDPKEVHQCNGCEPCPPAEFFAEYLIRRRNQ